MVPQLHPHTALSLQRHRVPRGRRRPSPTLPPTFHRWPPSRPVPPGEKDGVQPGRQGRVCLPRSQVRASPSEPVSHCPRRQGKRGFSAPGGRGWGWRLVGPAPSHQGVWNKCPPFGHFPQQTRGKLCWELVLSKVSSGTRSAMTVPASAVRELPTDRQCGRRPSPRSGPRPHWSDPAHARRGSRRGHSSHTGPAGGTQAANFMARGGGRTFPH